MNPFDTFVVRPVFNFLEFIYAIIPGHDLGIAIVIFTIVIRLLLWPLLRKQLHHGQAMRKLQPELKKIKKAAKGDKQQEMRLQMELYKEKGVRPIAGLGTLVIQLPIFIALYHAILKITNDPSSLVNFSYDWVRNLPWIHQLAENINLFDDSLLGIVDLSEKAIGGGSLYFPAIVVAAVSTYMQYHQTKLTMMINKDSRKLSVILKEAASGKEADQSEVTAAVSKLMLYVLPVFTFFFALIVPAALSLYLLTSSTVGYFQTRRILGEDAEEMQEIANEEPAKKTPKKKPAVVQKKVDAPREIIERKGSVVTKTTISTVGSDKPAATKKKPTPRAKKRRK